MLATPGPPNLRLRERRLNMRLMAHWQKQRDGRRFPALAEIDQNEIEDIWPDCFVIAVANDKGPSFQYIGAAIAESSGIEAGAPVVSAAPCDTLLRSALGKLDTVFSDKTVVTDSGVFKAADQAELLFRAILLPLSDDQETINFVIGGARCKALIRVPAAS